LLNILLLLFVAVVCLSNLGHVGKCLQNINQVDKCSDIKDTRSIIYAMVHFAICVTALGLAIANCF